MTCTCLTVPTSGPTYCGWCGILPPVPAAPDSLAARLAPTLADAALFTRLAETAPLQGTRNSLRWLARKASDSARLTATRWARGA